MAEKNIAALLDPKAYTIKVVYQHGSNDDTYTYVTNIPDLTPGDYVVVPTAVRGKVQAETPIQAKDLTRIIAELNNTAPAGAAISEELYRGSEAMRGKRLSIAIVVQVAAVVDIEPEAPIEYSWVISKVDLAAYAETLERNKQITDSVQSAYKTHLRRSFSERVLGELDQDGRAQILALLAK